MVAPPRASSHTMQITELISALCQHLQLDSLEPNEEGVYELTFDDGLDIEILSFHNNLLLRSSVGDFPEDTGQQEDFLRRLLNRSLPRLKDQYASLSIDEQQQRVWVYHSRPLNSLDIHRFCELVEQFVNAVAWWAEFESNAAPMGPMTMLPPQQFLRP